MKANRPVWLLTMTLALVLLSPAVSNARTIFVLIVADTHDESIGKGMQVDLDNLSFTFKICVPPEQLDLRTVTGRNVTKRSILRAIRRTRAGSHDGMVFFYAGHGGYDEEGYFFSLPGRTRLYRHDVVDAVRECGAGSDTVLSNSCNVFSPIEADVLAMEPGQRNTIAPLFKSLFLDSQGLADINGASEGEYGFTNPDVGSTFFFPLHLYLLENAGRSISWQTVVRELRPRVEDQFDSWFPNGYRDSRGRLQTTHSLRVWHLPPGWPGGGGGGGGGGQHRFGVQISNHRNPGVLVVGVFRGSPADRAEIDPGDVILSVNGVRVSSEAEMLRAVANSPRRMRFQLKGGRTGRIYDLEATLNP